MKNIKQVAPVFLLVMILTLGLAACQQTDEPQVVETGDAIADTATQAADTGEITAEGQIVPVRSVDLAFQLGGTVQDVLVSEGDMVAAGDPLIVLDSETVETSLRQAQAGLEAAQANLSAAQAQLSLAAAEKETATAAVTAAEAQLALVQAGARPEAIAAAEQGVAAAQAGVAQAAAQRDAALDVSSAQVQAAEARLAAAQAQYASLSETYDTIVTTCVDLPDGSEICPLLGAPEENARAQLEAARISRDAAQAALDEARSGATPAQQQSAQAGVSVAVAQRDLAEAQLALIQAGASEEQIRQAEVGVAQAELGLAQADVSAQQAQAAVTQAEAGVAGAEASVAAAQTALDRMTLVAPFDGTIGQVSVEIGELAAPSVTVATLADMSRWQVETTDLVELDIAQAQVGESATITLDALPGEELSGTIVDVASVPELVRGDVTYRTRLDLDEYGDLPLRWGMTAIVHIDTE
ncbi:MAG: efflux RND transporter periplasmic adaptor subunit [Chloroflexota bacterium]